jgi:hypothetical protein
MICNANFSSYRNKDFFLLLKHTCATFLHAQLSYISQIWEGFGCFHLYVILRTQGYGVSLWFEFVMSECQ